MQETLLAIATILLIGLSFNLLIKIMSTIVKIAIAALLLTILLIAILIATN